MSRELNLDALKIERPRRSYQRGGGGGSSWGGWVVLVLLGAAFLHPRSPATIWSSATVPSVRVVRVAREGRRADTVQGMASNGHVVAARRAALSADTPGRIVELNVTEGSQVEQGQVVARLYADEYAAALERARAQEASLGVQVRRSQQEVAVAAAEAARLSSNVAAATAEVLARQAELGLAKQEAERIEKLATRGASDQRELDRTRSVLQGARARVAQARSLEEAAERERDLGAARVTLARRQLEVTRSQLEVARAETALAEATLEKTRVRAPFSGIVVLKDAEVGEVVSPNVTGGASSRGAIVTMVDPDSLEVQAEVPETRLAAVRLGGAVQVFLDAAPEIPREGVVSRIWPTANLQKATVEVRIRFLGPVPDLRPDMGVRAVFLPEAPSALRAEEPGSPPPLEIPEVCLAKQGGRTGVWVEAGNQVRFRPLELGERKLGLVVVESGLRDGEEIVLAPPPGLAEGAAVQVAED